MYGPIDLVTRNGKPRQIRIAHCNLGLIELVSGMP
jgi:hypothetical protein